MGFMIWFIIIVVFLLCVGLVLQTMMLGGYFMWQDLKKLFRWTKSEIDPLVERNRRIKEIRSDPPKIDPYLIIPPLMTTDRIITSNKKQNRKRKAQYKADCENAEAEGVAKPQKPKLLPVTVEEIEELRQKQRNNPPAGIRPVD